MRCQPNANNNRKADGLVQAVPWIKEKYYYIVYIPNTHKCVSTIYFYRC